MFYSAHLLLTFLFTFIAQVWPAQHLLTMSSVYVGKYSLLLLSGLSFNIIYLVTSQ